MTTFDLLLSGLEHATGLANIFAVIIGVLLGLAVGALPALGPSAGTAILLPAIINLEPTVAIAGLCGVYYGAMYGGAVTSILLGVPGDSAAMMTTVDGYPMARRGEAGRALGMAVFASFFGGFISIVLMTALSVKIAGVALAFGPAEMTALMVLALCLVTVLGGENPYKGFVSLGIGLWVGVIGLDVINGRPRYTMGSIHLLEGIDFIIVVVGLYGLGQMFSALAEKVQSGENRPTYSLRKLLPRFADIVRCKWNFLISSLIGFFIGILPGTGATAATVFAYATAKRMSKKPEEFGKGSIEGVAAPESANNSASYSAMIPLFTLGIPGSGTTAVLLGGLMMLGLQPGPLLFSEQPDFVWTLFGTFYIGNITLVFLTIGLIPVLASLVFVRMSILFPVVVAVVMFGIYSLNNNMADVGITVLFGVVGYVFNKLSYPMLPILLGVILGPILEQNIRRSLIASGGSFEIFTDSVLATAILLAALGVLVLPMVMAKVKTARRSGQKA